MPRKSKNKPLITKNWLPIEYIHDCPNILTSYVTLAQMKREREAEGKPPSKRKWCVFCGRPFMSIQARNAHLQFCEKRRVYKRTKAEGWRFTIGSDVFIVRSMVWSWIREAASVEAELNKRIAAGTLTKEEAVIRFTWFVVGHQATHPRADAEMAEAPSGIPAEAVAEG